MAQFSGQRPGLNALPTIQITELSGNEFGIGLTKKQLGFAVDQWLREIQRGSGLPNNDTGWLFRINKSGRKKMGDNADQTVAESKAIAGLRSLVWHAVVGERHSDDEHRNPDVLAVFRLYAPVSIGGVLYRAKLTVKDYGDPKRLHALSAVEIENAPLGTFPAYSGAYALQQDQPTTGRTTTIADLLRGALLSNGTFYDFDSEE